MTPHNGSPFGPFPRVPIIGQPRTTAAGPHFVSLTVAMVCPCGEANDRPFVLQFYVNNAHGAEQDFGPDERPAPVNNEHTCTACGVTHSIPGLNLNLNSKRPDGTTVTP